MNEAAGLRRCIQTVDNSEIRKLGLGQDSNDTESDLGCPFSVKRTNSPVSTNKLARGHRFWHEVADPYS